jgi:hypothetical protein
MFMAGIYKAEGGFMVHQIHPIHTSVVAQSFDKLRRGLLGMFDESNNCGVRFFL